MNFDFATFTIKCLLSFLSYLFFHYIQLLSITIIYIYSTKDKMRSSIWLFKWWPILQSRQRDWQIRNRCKKEYRPDCYSSSNTANRFYMDLSDGFHYQLLMSGLQTVNMTTLTVFKYRFTSRCNTSRCIFSTVRRPIPLN